MATKLYLHDAAFVTSGTAPSTIQGVTTEWQVSGYTTCRTMNTTIGTGQTSRAGSSLAQTAAQQGFLGFFVSPPLDVDQTVGDVNETLTLNIASAESDLAMNLTDLRCELYVWRPSTASVVGTLFNYALMTGDAEPGAAGSERVNQGTTGSVLAISAQAGDVLVLEVFYNHSQANATSRTCTFYYDGTTENTTVNAVVSNHASFINLSLSNITFENPCFDIDATASATFGSSSTATSNINAASTANLTWSGASRAAAAVSISALANAQWVGQGFILSAAAFDIDAAASLTWNGAIVSAGALSAIQTASLSWVGRSFASSSWVAASSAQLTWNGRSTAASAVDIDATALLTWNGAGVASSALSAAAIALVTWNGEAVASADVEGAWASEVIASLTWDGAADATSDLTSTAVASITWNGTGIFPAAFAADTVSSVTWTGVTLASASWNANTAATLSWYAGSFASAGWQVSPAAAFTWNGVSTVASAWRADALGDLQWEGVGEGTPTTEDAAFSSTATAFVAFAAEVIVSAGFDMQAVSTAVWNIPRPVYRPIDGRRLSRIEDSDEEDIMLFMAAINTYLEQEDHDNY